MDISVTEISERIKRHKPEDESKLGFGNYVTNHMFLLDHNGDKGWNSPRIVPYGPLSIYPDAMILHYAQEVFEGMKAYRGPNGEISLFRPDENFKRFKKSCDRMCIPPVSEDFFFEGIKTLVKLEKDWVPYSPGTSLYIRPNIIATQCSIPVHPATEYLFYIITLPVAAYYASGFAPVKILVEDEYVRAAEGGIGAAKTAGNYSSALKAQEKAKAKGYSQVLWLDAKEKRYVEEAGTMNIMIKFKDELATPLLGDTILPGITRNSIMTIAKDMGIKTVERHIGIDEVFEKIKSQEIEEIFGTGTAAVVSPISHLCYKDEEVVIKDGATYPLSQELFEKLSGYQYGTIKDPYGWRKVIA